MTASPKASSPKAEMIASPKASSPKASTPKKVARPLFDAASVGEKLHFNLAIKPGDRFSFPILVEEPSVLSVEWTSENGDHVEFSLSFTPAERGEESMLVQPSRGAGAREVEIECPGSCLLVWKNCSTDGWFSAGVAPKVDILAMLTSKRGAEEKDMQRKEAEEKERRQAAVQLKRLAIAKKQEEVRKRMAEREEQLIGRRAEADESQVFLDATREGLSRHDAEIARLQEELAAVEQARSAEVAMASVTEQQLSAALDQIAALMAEQERDEVELQGEDDTGVACSSCGSVFTDDSVFCRTCAADRRDPGTLLAELQPKLDELIEHEAAAGSATAPAALSATTPYTAPAAAPTALSATAPDALSATTFGTEPDFEQPAEAAVAEIANNAEACASLPTALEEEEHRREAETQNADWV